MTSREEKDAKEKIALCLGRRWLGRRYPKLCLKGLTTSPEEHVFLFSSRYLVYRWSLLGLLIGKAKDDKAEDPTRISLTLPSPFSSLLDARAFVRFYLEDPSSSSLSRVDDSSTLELFLENGDYLGAQTIHDEWLTSVGQALEGLDAFHSSFRSFPPAPWPLSKHQDPILGVFSLSDAFREDAGLSSSSPSYPYVYLKAIKRKSGYVVPAEDWSKLDGKRGSWIIGKEDTLFFEPGSLVLSYNPSFFEPVYCCPLSVTLKRGVVEIYQRDLISKLPLERVTLWSPKTTVHTHKGLLNHWPFLCRLLMDSGEDFDYAKVFYQLIILSWSPLLHKLPAFGQVLLDSSYLTKEEALTCHSAWAQVVRHGFYGWCCPQHDAYTRSTWTSFSSLVRIDDSLDWVTSMKRSSSFGLTDLVADCYPQMIKDHTSIGLLGGAPLAWLSQTSFGRKRPFDDYDIFVVGRDPLPTAIKAALFFFRHFETAKPLVRFGPSTISIYPTEGTCLKPVQLILVKGSSLEEVLYSFDLNVCQVGIFGKAVDTGPTSTTRPLTFEACASSACLLGLERNQVAKVGPLYEEGITDRFLERLAKYKAKGFCLDPSLRHLILKDHLILDKPPEPHLAPPQTLEELQAAFPSSKCFDTTAMTFPSLQPLSLSLFDRSLVETMGGYSSKERTGPSASPKESTTVYKPEEVLRNTPLAELFGRAMELSDLMARTMVPPVPPRRRNQVVMTNGYAWPFSLELALWSIFPSQLRFDSFDDLRDQDHPRFTFFLKPEDESYDLLKTWGIVSDENRVYLRAVGSIRWAFSHEEVPWTSPDFRWPSHARVRCLCSGMMVQLFKEDYADNPLRKILTCDHLELYPQDF